ARPSASRSTGDCGYASPPTSAGDLASGSSGRVAPTPSGRVAPTPWECGAPTGRVAHGGDCGSPLPTAPPLLPAPVADGADGDVAAARAASTRGFSQVRSSAARV